MFTSILETVNQRREAVELADLAESAILEFEELDAEFSFVEGVAEVEAPELETDEEVILDEDDEEYDADLIDDELTVDDFPEDEEVMEAVAMCKAALAEMAVGGGSNVDSSKSMFESFEIKLESDDEDEDDIFEEDDEDLFESVSDIDTELDEDYISDEELDANSPEDFGGAADTGIVAGDEELDLSLIDDLDDPTYDDADEELFNNIMDDESNLLDV